MTKEKARHFIISIMPLSAGFRFRNNTSNRQIMRVTYDRKSRKPLASDKKDSFYSYSKTYVPFGVRQEGLPAYSETSVRDSLNLEELITPGSQ